MSGGTPWTAGPWSTNDRREVLTQKGRTVCRAHLDGGTRGEDETFANARLIAAAPEMAELLTEAVVAKDGIQSLDWFHRARALLTKIGASQ